MTRDSVYKAGGRWLSFPGLTVKMKILDNERDFYLSLQPQ